MGEGQPVAASASFGGGGKKVKNCARNTQTFCHFMLNCKIWSNFFLNVRKSHKTLQFLCSNAQIIKFGLILTHLKLLWGRGKLGNKILFRGVNAHAPMPSCGTATEDSILRVLNELTGKTLLAGQNL